jgi:hypothetical protein
MTSSQPTVHSCTIATVYLQPPVDHDKCPAPKAASDLGFKVLFFAKTVCAAMVRGQVLHSVSRPWTLAR